MKETAEVISKVFFLLLDYENEEKRKFMENQEQKADKTKI